MVYEAAKSGLTDLDLPYVILPRLIRRRSVVPSKGPRVIIGSDALLRLRASGKLTMQLSHLGVRWCRPSKYTRNIPHFD